MLSLGLILLSVCTLVWSVPTCSSKPYFDTELAEVHFEKFMTTFNKSYEHDMEKQHRMEIFRKNLKKINELNADPTESAHFGINQFTDLTEEELRMYKGFEPSPHIHEEPQLELKPPPGPIPEGLDWRQKGAVSRVKQQGRCLSCWAFGASGVTESAYFLKHGEMIEVSEQELVDCASDFGCTDGGDPYEGLLFYKSKGADSESSYPYRGVSQPCQFKPQAVKVRLSNVMRLPIRNEEDLVNALHSYGPIAVGVWSDSWHPYAGGIFENCPANRADHAVLLVGYGSENGKPYWIIKNSWGTSWGEQGYMRLRRGINACNIAHSPAVAAMAA